MSGALGRGIELVDQLRLAVSLSPSQGLTEIVKGFSCFASSCIHALTQPDLNILGYNACYRPLLKLRAEILTWIAAGSKRDGVQVLKLEVLSNAAPCCCRR
jgi:hypothetical protein